MMEIPQGTFCYVRRVAFADTDAMGVVHHARYLLYLEEARVAWMRERGLIHLHYPFRDLTLAVLESRLVHRSAARFEEELKLYVQVRRQRLKIQFQYAILGGDSRLVALGYTELVPTDSQLKVLRPPRELTQQLAREVWTETWL